MKVSVAITIQNDEGELMAHRDGFASGDPLLLNSAIAKAFGDAFVDLGGVPEDILREIAKASGHHAS